MVSKVETPISYHVVVDFLPVRRLTAWEAILPFLGAVVFIVVFVFFPLVLYGIIGSRSQEETCFCDSAECVTFPRDKNERGWPYVPNFIEEDYICTAN